MVFYKNNDYKICFCNTVKLSNKMKRTLSLKITKLIKRTIKILKHNNVDLSKNNIIELMPKFIINNKLVVLDIFYDIERRNCCVCSCFKKGKVKSRIYN